MATKAHKSGLGPLIALPIVITLMLMLMCWAYGAASSTGHWVTLGSDHCYHRPACSRADLGAAHLEGLERDGFTPCPACKP